MLAGLPLTSPKLVGLGAYGAGRAAGVATRAGAKVGITSKTDAFTVEGTGSFFGELLIGLLKLALGVYLLRHPDVSIVALTLLLAAVFMVDGAVQVALAFELRPIDGWVWGVGGACIYRGRIAHSSRASRHLSRCAWCVPRHQLPVHRHSADCAFEAAFGVRPEVMSLALLASGPCAFTGQEKRWRTACGHRRRSASIFRPNQKN